MPHFPIDAAIRSTRPNECYLFVKEKYVVVNYAPGGKKSEIINGPIHISDGFPVLGNTIFETGIDCAFETEGSEAFIFSGDQCAKIDFGPNPANATLLIDSIPITAMFRCLKGTVFEHGIDSAIRFTDKIVILFKGDKFVNIDYHSKRVLWATRCIGDAFTCMVGTVFEGGMNTGFASHIKNEIYIFKDTYYARINIGPFATGGDSLVDGRIKRLRDDWPALGGILKY